MCWVSEKNDSCFHVRNISLSSLSLLPSIEWRFSWQVNVDHSQTKYFLPSSFWHVASTRVNNTTEESRGIRSEYTLLVCESNLESLSVIMVPSCESKSPWKASAGSALLTQFGPTVGSLDWWLVCCLLATAGISGDGFHFCKPTATNTGDVTRIHCTPGLQSKAFFGLLVGFKRCVRLSNLNFFLKQGSEKDRNTKIFILTQSCPESISCFWDSWWEMNSSKLFTCTHFLTWSLQLSRVYSVIETACVCFLGIPSWQLL